MSMCRSVYSPITYGCRRAENNFGGVGARASFKPFKRLKFEPHGVGLQPRLHGKVH